MIQKERPCVPATRSPFLDHQVVHRDDRQVASERLPGRTVVQGDIYARLGARVQQAPPIRVFPDHSREVVVRDPIRDALPRLAVVVRLVQHGTIVIMLVSGGGHVRGRRIVRRRLDHVYHRERLDAGGSYLRPAASAVPGDMDEAVIAPGPQDAGLVMGLGERVDGAVDLRRPAVRGDRPARYLLLRDVVARQVRADRLPARPLVGRSEDDVACGVEHPRIVGGRRLSGMSS